MIKSINGNNGIVVNGGSISWPQFYNSVSTSNNTLVGQIRYNGSSQNLEVYDGVTWLHLPSAYPMVELSGEVQSVLNWARNKMSEESRMRELATKHPAVADAVTAVKTAEEKLQALVALTTV